jgi:DNA repair protein RadC
VFVIVLLDAQNRVLATEELFLGTLSQTSVYLREVVKVALRHNALVVPSLSLSDRAMSG